MFLAHVDPAGGAPTQDLIPAAFVAFAALLGLLLLARPHRTGRSHLLGRATRWTTRPGVRGRRESLSFGLVGDREAMDDLEDFAGDLRAAIEELAATY